MANRVEVMMIFLPFNFWMIGSAHIAGVFDHSVIFAMWHLYISI